MTYDEKIVNCRRLKSLFEDLSVDFTNIVEPGDECVNRVRYDEFGKRLEDLCTYFATQEQLQELFKLVNA